LLIQVAEIRGGGWEESRNIKCWTTMLSKKRGEPSGHKLVHAGMCHQLGKRGRKIENTKAILFALEKEVGGNRERDLGPNLRGKKIVKGEHFSNGPDWGGAQEKSERNEDGQDQLVKKKGKLEKSFCIVPSTRETIRKKGKNSALI